MKQNWESVFSETVALDKSRNSKHYCWLCNENYPAAIFSKKGKVKQLKSYISANADEQWQKIGCFYQIITDP